MELCHLYLSCTVCFCILSGISVLALFFNLYLLIIKLSLQVQKEAKEWLSKHSSGQSESTEGEEDKLEIKVRK